MKYWRCLWVLGLCVLLTQNLWAVTRVSRVLTFGSSNLLKFSMSPSSLSWPSLSPDVGSYDYASVITLTVKSNNSATTWYVKAVGSGPFTSAASPSTTFPLARLGFKLSTGSTYTSMSTTAQTVLSGGIGQSTKYVDYRMTVDWDMQSATDYQETITYTCTTTP